MANTTNDVLGVVHPDGTLELQGELTVPPGRVRVHVESLEPQPPPAEDLVEFVRRLQREMAATGHRFMTDEETAAWTEELRADGDRIEEAYRQAEEGHE